MSIQSLANPQELFDSFARPQAEEYAARAYPRLDIELLPIIEKLNNLPGIATIDSCAGHPKERADNLYISVVPTSLGLDVFSKIYRLFLTAITHDKALSKSVSQTYFTCRYRKLAPRTDVHGWVWTLRVYVRTETDKQLVLQTLSDVVGQVGKDYVADHRS